MARMSSEAVHSIDPAGKRLDVAARDGHSGRPAGDGEPLRDVRSDA